MTLKNPDCPASLWPSGQMLSHAATRRLVPQHPEAGRKNVWSTVVSLLGGRALPYTLRFP